jgi:hypothetical protein
MADQIYKVRDPEGNIREISGPAGASDNVVIAKAQELFSKIGAKSLADQIPGIQPIPEAQPTPSNLQVGINAANKGIAGVPDFLLNTPNSLINLGKAAYGTAATALGRSDLAPELTENPDYARKAMSAMGFIKPQFEPVTTGQRILDIGVQGAVGAAMPQTSVSNLIKALSIGGASGAAAGGVKELTGSDAAAISAGLLLVVITASLQKSGIAVMKGNSPEIGLVKNLGRVLMTEYLVPFELSGILFIAAMVGAVLLGKRDSEKQDLLQQNDVQENA